MSINEIKSNIEHIINEDAPYHVGVKSRIGMEVNLILSRDVLNHPSIDMVQLAKDRNTREILNAFYGEMNHKIISATEKLIMVRGFNYEESRLIGEAIAILNDLVEDHR